MKNFFKSQAGLVLFFLGILSIPSISFSQSLSEQYSNIEQLKKLEAQRRLDDELIRQESLKRSQISLENFVEKGLILECSGFDGGGRAFSDFLSVQSFLRSHVILNDKIYRFKPGSADAGPSLRGSVSSVGDILKSDKVEGSSVQWEHNLKNRQSFITIDGRIYKSTCTIIKFKPL